MQSQKHIFLDRGQAGDLTLAHAMRTDKMGRKRGGAAWPHLKAAHTEAGLDNILFIQRPGLRERVQEEVDTMVACIVFPFRKT